LIFAHDDEKLISGGGDKTIRIWDIKSFQWLATYEGHTA
jgi:WD40 repeat protein